MKRYAVFAYDDHGNGDFRCAFDTYDEAIAYAAKKAGQYNVDVIDMLEYLK